jgi:hypothetical protein
MTPDDDLPDDLDTIPLHGVSLPLAESADDKPDTPATDADDTSPTLTFRPYDDGVPGRDFQPRLLRFGEAA